MADEAYPLTKEQVAFFSKNGYIQIKNLFTKEEVSEFQKAFNDAVNDKRGRFFSEQKEGEKKEDKEHWHEHESKEAYEQIFKQMVNVWRDYDGFRKFTLHPKIGSIARQLAQVSRVRLFHDHALIKPGGTTSLATPWHQDLPYWPVNVPAGHPGPLSAWVAGDDVTTANGCMKFLPQSHKLPRIKPIPLGDRVDGLAIARQELGADVVDALPEPVAMDMEAGGVTFHDGLLFHYACTNTTDKPRRALSIIFLPEGVTYTGTDHACTNGLNLKVGEWFNDDTHFPVL